MNWNPDDYLAAWCFAARAHAGQTFKSLRPDEHLPYCVHLGVAQRLSARIADYAAFCSPQAEPQ